ncbi:MAG: pectate lyase family protein [Planctomycetota bacterium]|jgi:hypothetical protein
MKASRILIASGLLAVSALTYAQDSKNRFSPQGEKEYQCQREALSPAPVKERGPKQAIPLNHNGGDWVTVKDFGAKGDGINDDSAAFQNAFNSGAKKIFIPATSKYYLIKDVTLPVGVEIEGLGRKRVYTAFNVSDIEGSCAIVFNTSGSYCISFSGYNKISNLNFHGNDKSCDGFGPGSGGSLFFRDVGMYRFKAGFGKTPGSYTGNSRLWNCNANGNITGIRNFVDSHFYGCEINANDGEGVNLQAGANDNTFVGCKIEWNNKSNWKFYQCVNNNIIGGVTDRSGGSYGFDIRQSQLTINGTVIRRNGRDDASTSAHFYIGSNVSLLLNGIITKTGANDDGSGNTTPNYIFSVTDTSSGPTTINGCDLTGHVTGLKTGTTLEAVFSGNVGITDNAQYIASNSASLSAFNTLTTSVSGLEVLGLNQYTSVVRRYKISASWRSTTTGNVAVNDFLIAITRGGGLGASATVYNIADSSSTNINTAGAVLNISIVNIASDGTSFDVVATNTSASTLQTRIEVLPFN